MLLKPEQRREEMVRLIHEHGPVTAAAIAERFGVTRQIVVHDVALLRAAGTDIIATPGGYMVPREPGRFTKVIACRHNNMDRLKEELYVIVDAGAFVRDVIVGHAVYGEITGRLMIGTRAGVDDLVRRLESSDGPLSSVTGGLHLHTIEAGSREVLDRVEKELGARGILA